MMSQSWGNLTGQMTPSHDSADTGTDETLVRRCRNGDVSAFGCLVAQHEARVRALAARILGATATRDDIDDLAQEIFVQAWRALPRFRGDAKFGTWLYRLATNMAIKEWHRRKRRSWISHAEDVSAQAREGWTDGAPGPSTLAERGAQEQALKAAVDHLPEKQRTAVLLHYFEDYSCEEVAQMTGCSVGTVWSRLHYACRKLRGSLDWLAEG